ncbi:MAG: CoA-binding protein [Flavobacteriaceae bacterium]
MKNKTLVFGASLKNERYSNMAIHKLRANNYEVVAFGLKPGQVSDVKIETELLSYTTIDTVTLYMNPKRQKAYYNYVLSLKPNRVIFNPGTENQEFYKLLKTNHIDYEVACTLVLLSTKQYSSNQKNPV